MSNTRFMTLYHISDTHGIVSLKELGIMPCHVLCITGDWSPLNIQHSEALMYNWIRDEFIPQMVSVLGVAEHVVLIGGNHDFVTEARGFNDWFNEKLENYGISDKVHYLCNSSVSIHGVNFYGCPYSDIHGWAWCADGYYGNYVCPDHTDVMLVHAAPRAGGLGETLLRGRQRDFGSDLLCNALHESRPKLLLCGHIHGGSHIPHQEDGCVMQNSSILDEDYKLAYIGTSIVFMEDNGKVSIMSNNKTFTI